MYSMNSHQGNSTTTLARKDHDKNHTNIHGWTFLDKFKSEDLRCISSQAFIVSPVDESCPVIKLPSQAILNQKNLCWDPA